MKRILYAALLLGFTNSALADEDLTVLSQRPDGIPPGKLLEVYLKQQFHQHLDQRLASYGKLKSRADCQAWQRERREFFVRQLGGFPKRTPLNARIVGRLEGKGYHVEKVIFESRPSHHVTANLYLPQTAPPYPAVLVPCGHSHNGKAAGGYQRISILLAKHGMAALCYDPIGQGERYQMLDFENDHEHFESVSYPLKVPHPRVQFLCTTEHTTMGLGCILLGTNIAQYRVWDGMRAIDYLQSRDDIIADKIGCTGNSGGGTLTAYLMALDDRIVAAAPACYLTTFRRLIDTKGAQDAEQNIFGQIAFGMDEPDYVIMRAPKPTLICASTRDATFDIGGTWDLFRQAKRFYSRLGFAERVELNEADVPHGFYIQHREAAARWMHRWLLGKDKLIQEVNPETLPDPISDKQLRALSDGDWTQEQLYCTPQGQVLLMKGEQSVFQLNAKAEQSSRKQRTKSWNALSDAGRRELVRKTIFQGKGLQTLAESKLPSGPAAETPSCQSIATLKRKGYTIEKLILTPEPGIRLPALAFLPAKPNGTACLYLHGQSMQEDSAAGGPIERLVRQGQIVLAAELRGIGETETGHDKRDYGRGRFGRDVQEIFLAYLIGRSYVGMRTEDAAAWTRFLAGFHAAGGRSNKIHLVAIGEAAIPALHAAALEPARYESVRLRNMIRSWSEVVGNPENLNQAANVVHGALEHYDLPDLIDLVDKKKVTIEQSVDALGKSISQNTNPATSDSLPATPKPAVAPFDAKHAKAQQSRWGQHLGAAVRSTNSLGTSMILIPPGEFLMGSSDAQVEAALEMAAELKVDENTRKRIRDAERPQHRMVIAEPLLLAATEVTIGQFRRFVDATGYRTQAEQLGTGNSARPDKAPPKERNAFNWRSPGFAQRENAAVSQVSWNDAVAFCNWLSEQEKLPSSYRPDPKTGWSLKPGAKGYRLPTEAEWEYAARAGTTTHYHCGNDPERLKDFGWFGFRSGSKPVRVVGAKQPNAFGLYDMHGNIGEWCQDFYDPASYPKHYVNDPTGSRAGLRRAVRGGDWWGNALRCRSAFRGYGDQVTRSDDLGFRLARSIIAGAPAEESTIRVVARETFFPAKERICVRSQSFYVRGEGLEKIRYRSEQNASDKLNNMQISRSSDNGRSWSKPEIWWTVKQTPAGIARRRIHAGWVDPETGGLIVMVRGGIWSNDKVLDRFGRGRMSYIVSRDGWRTELVNEPVDLTNAVLRDDGLFLDEREQEAPLFSMMFGDRTGRPIRTKRGEILQPVQLALFRSDTKRYNPGGGYTFTAAAMLIGKWRDDQHIDWSLSERVSLGPDRSTRGAIEPTIAALADGRILMILRGSNDARGQLPGHKWYALSADGGHTWSDVKVWTYSDGEKFFSPSSCSQLVTHSNGKTYWIGNIVPSNPQGNLPRRPIVIGEVDDGSGLLRRHTVVTIDDLQEDEHSRIMLSNFMAHEDRKSRNMLLHMSRPFAGGPGDWTSPAYLYRIAVEE